MHGHLEILKFFHEKGVIRGNYEMDIFYGGLCGDSKEVMEFLAQDLKFSRKEHLWDQFYVTIEEFSELFSKNSDYFDPGLSPHYAAAGRAEILRLAGKLVPVSEFRHIGRMAALREDKRVLQWLKEEVERREEGGMAWDPSIPLVEAAGLGREGLVLWMLEEGWRWVEKVATRAARAGGLKIIKVEFFLCSPLSFLLPPSSFLHLPSSSLLSPSPFLK
jgi:hypothetical protein